MSTKKQWTGKEKLAIVLQGMRCERSVSELSNEHGLTPGMYISGAISCSATEPSCSIEVVWVMSATVWSGKIASSRKPSAN